MANTRFLFARLNLIAQYEDKAEFVLAGLKSNQLRRVREHLWGFFEVEECDGFADYLTGFLAKVRPKNAEEVGDLVARSFAMTTVENRAIAKSRFFLHVPTGLIAYQYVSSHIPQHTFEEQFARLFEESYKQFFVTADVLTVEERANFLEAIRLFDRVQSISVSLHPTNPHYSEIYRVLDERLKALDAKEYKETISADPSGPGLRIADDDDIRRKATMAEDGYGKVSAIGTREGRPAQASTSENPLTVMVDAKDRPPTQILQVLVEEFAAIIRRIAA